MKNTFRPVMFEASEEQFLEIIQALNNASIVHTPLGRRKPYAGERVLVNDYGTRRFNLGYTRNNRGLTNRVEVYSVKEFIEACGIEYKETTKENIMLNTFKKVSFKPKPTEFLEILKVLINNNINLNDTNGSYLSKKLNTIVSNFNNHEWVDVGLVENSQSHNYKRIEVFSVKEFLEACNLKVETLKEKETRLANELKEVRKELKDQQPKVGDVGVFSDNDKSSPPIIGILGDIDHKDKTPYQLKGTMFYYDNFEPLKNSSDFDYSKLQELLKVK